MGNRRLFTLLLGCLLCLGLKAQNIEWDTHERSSAWSYGLLDVVSSMQNPASLPLVDSLKVAYVSLGAAYTGGAFRSSDDPLYSVGENLQARSTFHRGAVSLKGAFTFSNCDSWGQCGSMLLGGDEYPIGVYEFTPGRKTHQSYGVMGMISWTPVKRLRVGGGVDFLSQNIAKRKDLRHSNYRLDLRGTLGVVYSFTDKISLGVQYEYYKNFQTCEAEIIGSISDIYAFLDKGLGYGVYDVWNSGATHLKEAGIKGLPFNIDKHSLALQFTYANLFAEISAGMTSRAKVGEKNTIWYDFPYRALSGRIYWVSRRGKHFARFAFALRRSENNEVVLEKVTEGGVTNTVVLGDTRILEAVEKAFALEYECRAVERLNLIAGGRIAMKETLATPSYPLSAFQGDTFLNVYLKAHYNFAFGFTPLLSVGYNHCLSGTDSVTPGSISGVEVSEIYRNDAWFLEKNAYLRCGKVDVELDLRYAFAFRMFIGARGNVRCGLPGNGVVTRYSAGLYIGYNF